MATWKILAPKDHITTRWSGGTTTQLAIAPEGAVYADRDFLWRLSSAAVEDDHSTFTPLPDYDRLISVLEGQLEMKIGDGPRSPLESFAVRAFDGGTPVESWGRCRDFNLMVRKGECEGTLRSIELAKGSAIVIAPQVRAPLRYRAITAAIWCAAGAIELDGQDLTEGSLAIWSDVPTESRISISSRDGAKLMEAWILTDLIK